MTTASVAKPKTDRRGTNPKSLANLKPPWKPGEKPIRPGGYSVSHCLKDMLQEDAGGGKPTVRAVAESIVKTALTPGSRGYSVALTQLLDRTEGKVPGDGVQVNFNTIEVLIVEALEPANLLPTEGLNQ